MAKKVAAASLLALAMAHTEENIVKSRSGSGKITYLDRFVKCLLDEDGQPTEPKLRTDIVAEMSLEIALEKNPEFAFQNADGEPIEENIEEFKAINKKVHPMLNAAVSDSNNATALSYNEKYKTTWTVVKDGKYVSLSAFQSEETEA